MNYIILGGGFGDEGKGLFTKFLSSNTLNPLVVRFSGGHQAGHTVVVDGITHVHSHFGSGTLNGTPTYWSKYCTVEPEGLLRELNILKEKGFNPSLYIDAECPITTPYDISQNRIYRKTGTCGVGFSETIQREESFYSLKFLDLFYPKVRDEKLRVIKEYYNEIDDVQEFLDACSIITNLVNIVVTRNLPVVNSYIFEGSQGLLLDQHFGFFPDVTRSNTGCKNAVEIINENKLGDYEVFIITRAYQTRHGKGFMTNENIPHKILENKLETNKTNKYQGEFRRSLLDVSLLKYALEKDSLINKAKKRNLVITCLDHIINDYRFTFNDTIVKCSDKYDFVFKIKNILNTGNCFLNDIYLSESPLSKNIYKFYFTH